MSNEAMDVADPGTLARVRHIGSSGYDVVVELRNGSHREFTMRAPFTGTPVGSAVWLRPDGQVDPAPDALWEETTRIGVVEKVGEMWTLVEGPQGIVKVPNILESVQVRNTVEFTDDGIVAVLADTPVGGLSSLREDAVDVSRFRTDPPAPGAERSTHSFDSFGGFPDIVARAQELVRTPLQYAEALREIGADPIRGVLFTGPPGTGKTKLARIIAGESGATLYVISGPEIVSKFVGSSEELLRRIFADAYQRRPAIVFFDEIDSIAPSRGAASNEHSDRLVAELLTLMQGPDSRDGTVVIGTTNRVNSLDAALRRPGRFDWEINFRPPDLDDRREIVAVRASQLRTHGPLPLEHLAESTSDWTAADIVAIWNEAALFAVRDERRVVLAEDVHAGLQRVTTQRRSRTRGKAAAA